jgi:hypothetical protein
MSFSSAPLSEEEKPLIADFPLLGSAAFAPEPTRTFEPTQHEQGIPIFIQEHLIKFRQSRQGLLHYAITNGFHENLHFHDYLVAVYTPSTILNHLEDTFFYMVDHMFSAWQSREPHVSDIAKCVFEQFATHLPNLQTMEESAVPTYLPIIRMVFLQTCLDQNIFDSNGWVQMDGGTQDDRYCSLYPELSFVSVGEGQKRLLRDCLTDDALASRVFPFICLALEETVQTNITEYLFSSKFPNTSAKLAQLIFNRYLASLDTRYNSVREYLLNTPTVGKHINSYLNPYLGTPSLTQLIANQCLKPSQDQGYDYVKIRLLNFPSFDHFNFFANKLQPEQIKLLLSMLGKEQVENIFITMFHITNLPGQALQKVECYQAIGFDYIRSLIKKKSDLMDLLKTSPPEQRTECIQAIGFDYICPLIKDKQDLIDLLKILPAELITNFIQAIGGDHLSSFIKNKYDLTNLLEAIPTALIAVCIQTIGHHFVDILRKDVAGCAHLLPTENANKIILTQNFQGLLGSLPDDKKIACFEAIQPKDFDILIPNLSSLVETLKIIPADQKIRLKDHIFSLINTQRDLLTLLNYFPMDNDSTWKVLLAQMIGKLTPEIYSLRELIRHLPLSAETISIIKARYLYLVKSEENHNFLMTGLDDIKAGVVLSAKEELCTQTGHTLRCDMLHDPKNFFAWDDKLSILQNLENLFTISPVKRFSTLGPDIVIYNNTLGFIRTKLTSINPGSEAELNSIIEFFEETLKRMDIETPIEHLNEQLTGIGKKSTTESPPSQGLFSIFSGGGSVVFQNQRPIALQIQFALNQLNNIVRYGIPLSGQPNPNAIEVQVFKRLLS